MALVSRASLPRIDSHDMPSPTVAEIVSFLQSCPQDRPLEAILEQSAVFEYFSRWVFPILVRHAASRADLQPDTGGDDQVSREPQWLQELLQSKLVPGLIGLHRARNRSSDLHQCAETNVVVAAAASAQPPEPSDTAWSHDAQESGSRPTREQTRERCDDQELVHSVPESPANASTTSSGPRAVRQASSKPLGRPRITRPVPSEVPVPLESFDTSHLPFETWIQSPSVFWEHHVESLRRLTVGGNSRQIFSQFLQHAILRGPQLELQFIHFKFTSLVVFLIFQQRFASAYIRQQQVETFLGEADLSTSREQVVLCQRLLHAGKRRHEFCRRLQIEGSAIDYGLLFRPENFNDNRYENAFNPKTNYWDLHTEFQY